MTDPYRPPDSESEPSPAACSAAFLLVVGLVYGVAGTVLSFPMVLLQGVSAACSGSPSPPLATELAWCTSAALSVAVPVLLYRRFGPACLPSLGRRVVLGTAAVGLAVGATFVGWAVLDGSLWDEPLPTLLAVAVSSTVFGALLSPAGVVLGLVVVPWGDPGPVSSH